MFSNTRRFRVEWGHCDPAKIVYNPRFFEYFDWSAALLIEAAITAIGFDATLAEVRFPLVATQASFLRPCSFGQEVEIVSTIIKVGRSSLEIEHRLFCDGELAVECFHTRVWAAADANGMLRSQPIPDALAERLRTPL